MALINGSVPINIPAGALPVGDDQLTATYSGDSNYNSQTLSTAVTVTVPEKTTPTITWSNPAAISYSTPLSATQLNATASVAGSFSYTPPLGTVLTAGPQVLTASFMPTDTTDYNTASASVTLTVNKTTPTITWNTPAAVTVGTALSSMQLNATASVAGAFVYSPDAGTVMSTAGNTTLSATFAPTDTTNYNNATATVLVTVNPAVTGATGALLFVPMTPCRLVDTRNATGAFGGPSITGETSRSFVIPSSACGVPSTAAAYSINVTAVPQAGLGYLTVWPTGMTQPGVSTLNSDGRVKANAAIVPAGTSGAISVYATDTTDVVLDINGYFVPATSTSALAFYPLTPCRVADTRNPTGSFGGPSLVGMQARAFPILSSACNIPSSAQAYSLNFTAVPQAGLGYLSAWPTGQAWPGVSTLNAPPTNPVVANAAIVPAGTGGADQRVGLQQHRRGDRYQWLLRASKLGRRRPGAVYRHSMSRAGYAEFKRLVQWNAAGQCNGQFLRNTIECGGLCAERDGRTHGRLRVSDAVAGERGAAGGVDAERG